MSRGPVPGENSFYRAPETRGRRRNVVKRAHPDVKVHDLVSGCGTMGEYPGSFYRAPGGKWAHET